MNKEKPALAGAGRNKREKIIIGKDTNYFYMIPDKAVSVLERLKVDVPGFKKSRLFEVVSMITARSSKRNGKEKGWVKLSMPMGRKIVPGFDIYIGKLMSLKIIERSGTAIKGNQSFKYRIHDKYWSDIKGFPLKDMALLRRIKLTQRKYRIDNCKNNRSQIELIENLRIDTDALKVIELIQELDSRAYATIAYYNILNKNFFYTVDKTSYRFHSNLTNLPRILRPYVSVNGQRLINIDISNCQFYLILLILTNPVAASSYARSEQLINTLKHLKVNQTQDTKLYIDLVTKGTFYEYLLEKLTERGVQNLSRERVKKLCYFIFFSNNKIKTVEKEIITELFPEVCRVIRIVKGNDRGNKFVEYNRFAILLQTIESKTMLESVVVRLNTEHPEVAVLTIHDSVMTTIISNHLEIVKEVIIKEFERVVGYKPKIKEE